MSDEAKVTHIVVLIAMEAEAKPLLEAYKLQQQKFKLFSSAPSVVYTGESHNGDCRLSVVTNGKCSSFGVDNVGTTPATVSAMAAIAELKPCLIINAGTAGGFKSKGATIGDAFISTKCANHDRRIPIPGFTEYGIGFQDSTPCPKLIEALNLKSGVVTTSNSLDHNESDDKLMAENDASVKDMEAAAIAWVAKLSNIPFFALKVVTDIVDGDRPSHEEFLENLHHAAVSLQEKLPKVIDFLAGKTLSEI
mmetsp:Transcript_24058/g.34462  ORF Transcript_24058/g.34462 Transcript_24058/m.34462 type:complete len:250 (+) Transcript_24058:24-773(+)